MNTIHGIIFSDDAILIEYSPNENTPFSQSIQLRVPYQAAQMHKQLQDDLNEVVADAQTLLDSALKTKIGGGQVTFEEMGRT